MRVTHVITRLILGGAQENTVSTVLGLRAKPGLTVRLLSGPATRGEGSLEAAFRDCPGVLALVPHLVRPVHPWHDALAWRELLRLFRRDRPDLVHTHSGKAGFLGRLAAHRAGVPLIVHTIHGPSFGPFQGVVLNTAYHWAERRAAAVTTHFISVAGAMTRQYLAAGLGRPDQFTCIRSGFELEPFLAVGPEPAGREALGLAKEDFVVGKIARLCELKGHDDLFAAAPALVAACPRMKFLLVGDGPWRARLEVRAGHLGLRDRFVFAGLVPPDRIPAMLGAMDVVAHLSRREGLARAIPQALAAARPVVAYDGDGAGEVCLDGRTGFLVAPGDLARLRERLLQLFADPPLRRRLGQAGRALVREPFPIGRMVDEIYALYLRLAREGGRR